MFSEHPKAIFGEIFIDYTSQKEKRDKLLIKK